MSPETEEHKRIKGIVTELLKTQFGLALKEYPDSGGVYDVKAITKDGISIFVENVWASSKGNFQRDLTILLRSNDKVKIFIVNPKILLDKFLLRDFEKTRMTEIEKGFLVSHMIDGSRVLNDPNYVTGEFAELMEELVTEARKKELEGRRRETGGQEQLRHSRQILLTRSDYQGLDHWAKASLVENLLLHGNYALETRSLMQHFETGYQNELWSALMEYKSLMEKYNNPIAPFHLRFQDDIGGYWKNLSDKLPEIPEKDRRRLLELKEQLLDTIDRIIFMVKNGTSLKGRCDFCP